ncbi:MAG: sugar transferase, partial [Acidobacteriota bacterium]
AKLRGGGEPRGAEPLVEPSLGVSDEGLPPQLSELSELYGRSRRSRDLRFQVRRFAWSSVIKTTLLLKRTIDIFGSACGLLMLAPLFLVVAVLVKLDSPGPVFFGQERVGWRGTRFKMWKFRSMFVDAEERKARLMEENEMEGGVLFKMRDDPRVTRVGKFVRKTSIDELPQLWNVLRGDMSLVGPRPPVPTEVAEYGLDDRRRLEITPGITCIWQVSGRSEIPFEQQVELDVDYIYTQSFWSDIWLLLKTVPAVLLGKGAF